MAQHPDPHAPATARDVERALATMAELSLDLMRAIRAAVPIALHETLGADLDPARLERVAEVILEETAARFRVVAGATLLTIRH
ncbi:MAG: hypothetical protein WCE44_14725 [Candidatus Velthaea sp.]